MSLYIKHHCTDFKYDIGSALQVSVMKARNVTCSFEARQRSPLNSRGVNMVTYTKLHLHYSWPEREVHGCIRADTHPATLPQ
jgi:hypothetical protein